MFFKRERKENYRGGYNGDEYITVINGETAIKPYYYLRNGLLHVRYNVDRCIELSQQEVDKIKGEIAKAPYNKQNILCDNWQFLTNLVQKEVIYDGVKAMKERTEKLTKEYNSGHSN